MATSLHILRSPPLDSSPDLSDSDDSMDDKATLLQRSRIEQLHGGHGEKEEAENENEGLREESFFALADWPSFSQVKEELWRLWDLGAAVMVMEVLMQLRLALSFIFLGHLSQSEIAMGSLAISFANITGVSVLVGLASSIEPLCSQAFGAKQYAAMSHTFQRAVLLLLAACIPMSALWMNAESILVFAGQDPALSHLAGRYLRYLTPDLFMMAIFLPFAIYLRSQGITRPIMLCSVSALALFVPINIVLVYGMGLSAIGNAIANAVFTLTMLVFLVLFVYRSGALEDRWPGLSKECFREWQPLLKLALPSTLSICLEWWFYEIIVFLAGRLPNPAVAISSITILTQVALISYGLLLGLSAAACTLVGNELGANRPARARRVTLVSLSASSLAGLACALFYFTLRGKLGLLFTSDAGVLALMPSMFMLLSISEIFNWVQLTMTGVLRGSARPGLSSILYFLCFYAIGLPLSLVFTFWLGAGPQGLWGGFIIASIILAVCSIAIAERTDWVLEAHKAQDIFYNEQNAGFMKQGGGDFDMTSTFWKEDSTELSGLPLAQAVP